MKKIIFLLALCLAQQNILAGTLQLSYSDWVRNIRYDEHTFQAEPAGLSIIIKKCADGKYWQTGFLHRIRTSNDPCTSTSINRSVFVPPFYGNASVAVVPSGPGGTAQEGAIGVQYILANGNVPSTSQMRFKFINMDSITDQILNSTLKNCIDAIISGKGQSLSVSVSRDIPFQVYCE